MKIIKVITFILLFGCSQQKKIPNYKVTDSGYIIWRYSKPGEPKMDILSNGDTLVTERDTMYILKKRLYN